MSASVERAEADARVDDVIIDVQELRKTYPGGIEAVKGISFQVMKGEVFGFLGPNGAGKSTTIMMLTTLLRPTAGTAVINGFDIAKAPYEVRMQLGYVSQDLAVDDNLTGRENLRLQAGFYHIPKDQVNPRINEVLELVGLADRADDLVESYSGGMRKRLDIACGLIHRPRVLFLDEPTLGLDIQTRYEIWRHIERLRRENSMTMFLTTHYMEEADTLCDRIAIIDRGVIKAIGSPGALKAQLGGDVIYIRFDEAHADRIAETVEALRALPEVKEVRAHRDDMHGIGGKAQDGSGGRVLACEGRGGGLAGWDTGSGRGARDRDMPGVGLPDTDAPVGSLHGGQTRGDSAHYLEYTIVATNGDLLLPRIFETVQAKGTRIASVSLKKPTLDDVYLAYTGRALRDEHGSREDARRFMMAMRRVRR